MGRFSSVLLYQVMVPGQADTVAHTPRGVASLADRAHCCGVGRLQAKTAHGCARELPKATLPAQALRERGAPHQLNDADKQRRQPTRPLRQSGSNADSGCFVPRRDSVRGPVPAPAGAARPPTAVDDDSLRRQGQRLRSCARLEQVAGASDLHREAADVQKPRRSTP